MRWPEYRRRRPKWQIINCKGMNYPLHVSAGIEMARPIASVGRFYEDTHAALLLPRVVQLKHSTVMLYVRAYIDIIVNGSLACSLVN